MEIGAFEAKTHLSALLDQVAKGARITITKHGKAVALLVPPDEKEKLEHAEIAAGLRSLRSRIKPGKMSVRDLIREGRRR